ncbi:MAG: hypothetical protein ABJR05_12385 [Balneola sp.]
MYTLRDHIFEQVKVAEKVATDLSRQQHQDFIQFCFTGNRVKGVKGNAVHIPPNLKTGYKPSVLPIPTGIFHPEKILGVDHISVKAKFSVSYSEKEENSCRLKGSFSSFHKRGIKSKIKIKRGEVSAGSSRVLNLLTEKITNKK